jgi:hypothetical protein
MPRRIATFRRSTPPAGNNARSAACDRVGRHYSLEDPPDQTGALIARFIRKASAPPLFGRLIDRHTSHESNNNAPGDGIQPVSGQRHKRPYGVAPVRPFGWEEGVGHGSDSVGAGVGKFYRITKRAADDTCLVIPKDARLITRRTRAEPMLRAPFPRPASTAIL